MAFFPLADDEGPGYRALPISGELSNTFGRTERVPVSWDLWTVPYAWLYVHVWHQTVICHCKEAVLHTSKNSPQD